MFFYLDSDLHRARGPRNPADKYIRSGARGVFVHYALPLLVPLALVGVGAIWGALVFIALSAVLVAASVESMQRMVMSGGSGSSLALVVNEVLTTVAVVVLIILPWVLGGWVPPPSAFVPSLLLALASGFASTVALVMALFEAAGNRSAAT